MLRTPARLNGTLDGMRKVVDSNALRTPALTTWLSRSPSNVAVITDYLAMEALKGDARISARKSMEVLCRFPKQVAILKPTTTISGLAGISRGIQRRMIDHPQTNRFGNYCKALYLADNREKSIDRQIEKLARTAEEHFDRVSATAESVRSSGLEIANKFTKEERTSIRSAATWPDHIYQKFVSELLDLSRRLLETHPSVSRHPSPVEIFYTYLFRSALVSLLLVFEYADGGGVPNRATHRLVNDLSDTHFATYATFFDGLITEDKRQGRLYQDAQNALKVIKRKANV